MPFRKITANKKSTNLIKTAIIGLFSFLFAASVLGTGITLAGNAYQGATGTGSAGKLQNADGKSSAMDKLKSMGIPFDKAVFLKNIRKGNYDVARLFLKAGIDPDARNPKDGNTALIYASMNGNVKIVKLLLSYNADVNAKSNDGFTATAAAIFTGHPKVLKILQEYSNSNK